MFCVIQKVSNKKPDKYGHHKELKVTSFSYTSLNGESKTEYSYSYGKERFERPVKDAYKISIHKSYRVNGKVKKKQWVICTMDYYALLEYWPGDCITQGRLNEKLEEMGLTEEQLWDMVYQKLDPLVEEVRKEYEQTEEYKTNLKHEKILTQYRTAKYEFEKEYGSKTYDYCYDIFGTLRNKEYLEQLKVQKKSQEEYQKRSYENFHQNYSNYDFGGFSIGNVSRYTDDEKGMLKKFYRDLSKKYHPDVTNDDGSSMKFLTKLKEQWGI
jgi:6-pyruvoyl-tetrahydropterin synthase